MPLQIVDWSALPDSERPAVQPLTFERVGPASARPTLDEYLDGFARERGLRRGAQLNPRQRAQAKAAYERGAAQSNQPLRIASVEPLPSSAPLTFERIDEPRPTKQQINWSGLPDQTEPQPQQSQGSAVGRFASGAWEMLNPIEMVKGAVNTVRHPIDTASNIIGAQVAQGSKALAAAREGRYSEMVGHAGAFVLPLIGPAAANAGERIGSGDIAGGLGNAVGLVGGVLAPGTAARAAKSVGGGISVPALLRNPNPAAVEAVEAGARAGVPIDAATATGNRFVAAAQHMSDRSVGGAGVAGRAAQAQQRGLATMGEQLAAKGYAQPVTPELAGEAVRTGVAQAAGRFANEADAAYSALRKIEADPAHAKPIPVQGGGSQLVPLPVEIAPAKDALRPIYQDLLRQSELTPLQGSKGRALVALDRLMQAPDAAPLSVVDGALSELKSFIRQADGGPLDAGRSAVQRVVSTLDGQVEAAARRAGPDALKALRDGRAATIEKYGANDVLEALNREPVKTFKGATQAGDAAIEHLRDVQKYAPAELPKIGRAVLDDMIGKATANGGFEHADAIAAKWASLGAETKRLLYRDPGYVRELDNFFHLAKMTARNANPSGTASSLAAGVQGAALFRAVWDPITAIAAVAGPYAVSKLLHSSAGVRLLTRGIRIPIGNKAAQAAVLGEASNLLRFQLNTATATASAEAPDDWLARR